MNSLIKNKKFIRGKDWVWYAPNTSDAFGVNEKRAVAKVLDKGWLALGETAKNFEDKVANIFGKNMGFL